MARMVDADDLGGAQKVADLAGVHLTTAYGWAERPDFAERLQSLYADICAAVQHDGPWPERPDKP